MNEIQQKQTEITLQKNSCLLSSRPELAGTAHSLSPQFTLADSQEILEICSAGTQIPRLIAELNLAIDQLEQTILERSTQQKLLEECP